MDVQVTGDAAVAAALRGLAGDTGDLDAFGEIADDAAATIAAATKRKSGQLAGSIRPGRSRNTAYVTATAPYAGAINYGWPARGIAAQHYMQAADGGAPQARAVERIDTDLDRQIDRRGLS